MAACRPARPRRSLPRSAFRALGRFSPAGHFRRHGGRRGLRRGCPAVCRVWMRAGSVCDSASRPRSRICALGWNAIVVSLFNPFLFIQLILEGGLFMAAWGYWHVTERTLALTQTAEAERVRDQQHLFNARLLTLQARVEPQFLFDALSQVRATHERDKGLADALLTDMITLLRVMLPIASASTSTVEREFGLVGAWVRVQRQLGGCAELNIVSPGEA